MDWCNVNDAGYGIRPMNETGDDMTDAFVWVKNGTSDPAAPDCDSACGLGDSRKPMPGKGEAYFEMLVRNARPPIDVG
jgi:cellulose 1,4-beta-cellobiosidase